MNLDVLRRCQVYTPTELAASVVRALNSHEDSLWLEPSCGTGVFLQALSDDGVPKRLITGIDIAQDSELCDRHGRVLRGTEFLDWSCQNAGLLFDRVVGNPPFVGAAQLDEQLRMHVANIVAPGTGIRLGARANLWYAFLSCSISMLKPDGGIGFVLPAAWEYADYARPLRNSMTKLFRRVFVFRSRRPLFQNAEDGSVVLIADGYQRKNEITARFEVDGLNSTIEAIESISGLNNFEQTKNDFCKCDGSKVGDYLSVRLGGVTGDSDYFLMSETKRLQHHLPEVVMKPVVTKSKHIRGLSLSRSDWQKLREQGERVWLFCPSASDVGIPAVKDYLNLPKEHGGCTRDAFKVRSRTNWFETPLPNHVDGFVSGMSNRGPILASRKMRGLNATNTLYVFRFHHNLETEIRRAVSLAMISSPFQAEFEQTAGNYPLGLRKVEPTALCEMRLPRMSAKNVLQLSNIYSWAEGAIAAGEIIEAQNAVDRILRKGRS